MPHKKSRGEEPVAKRTRVTVVPDYRLTFGPVGVLMDVVLVRRAYRNAMRTPPRGVKRHVESASTGPREIR